MERIDGNSNGAPPSSFKSLLAALTAIQGQYVLLKDRAEERERIAAQEITFLTHKVVSLETEVTDLRVLMELTIQDKLSTIVDMQKNFKEFDIQSDRRQAEFVKNAQLLRDRTDNLQMTLQELKEPTSYVSPSSAIISLDSFASTSMNSEDPVPVSSIIAHPDLPEDTLDKDVTTLRIYFAAPTKMCPFGDYTPTLIAKPQTVIYDSLENVLSNLENAVECRFWRVPASQPGQLGWYFPINSISVGGGGLVDIKVALGSSILKDGDAIVIESKTPNGWLTSLPQKLFEAPLPPPQVIRP